MTTITFRDWTLKVDYEVTKATYAAVAHGSAEGCGCSDCKNYIEGRDRAFPDEIKLLFDQLGLDCRKESEVWRMYKDKDGRHIYNGFFHFKGSFEGKDCTVPIGGNQYTFSMTPIDESFSIGFRIESELAYFKDTENLVQVEYETKVPWAIDKKLESEW